MNLCSNYRQLLKSSLAGTAVVQYHSDESNSDKMMPHDQWGPHWFWIYQESLNTPLLDREGGKEDEDTVDNENTPFSMARANIMTACVIAAAGCEYSCIAYLLCEISAHHFGIWTFPTISE